jgi:hypothetical protein
MASYGILQFNQKKVHSWVALFWAAQRYLIPQNFGKKWHVWFHIATNWVNCVLL